MRRVSTRLGELDCLLVESLPEGVSPTLAVVLCHGYGAPATDLVPLGSQLMGLRPELARQALFVFPAAPLSLAEMGMPGARAWFPLPMDLFSGAVDWDRFSSVEPQGFAAARRALMSAVSALSVSTKLPYERIALGGFSQGGMMATEVALRLEERPAALAILSGTLLTRDEWKTRAAARKELPVFQGHGEYDDILPFKQAQRLRTLLTEAGLSVDFFPFDGPHTIAPEELKALSDFLVARLAGR